MIKEREEIALRNAGGVIRRKRDATVPFPPQWGWGTSSTGDGVAWQVYFGIGSQIPSDLALSLYTTQQTTIPEPGSLMLLGSGIIGIASVLRRKLGA